MSDSCLDRFLECAARSILPLVHQHPGKRFKRAEVESGEAPKDCGDETTPANAKNYYTDLSYSRKRRNILRLHKPRPPVKELIVHPHFEGRKTPSLIEATLPAHG